MLKRSFDICFAVLVLAITSPLCLLITVAIWIDSGRPIFFRQERTGFCGEPFVAWKFKTLHYIHPDPNHTPCCNSCNVTRFGRLLRRTHLDELPQLLNVLSGDLAVIGPRAEVPKDSKPIELLRMKPGITGPAHIGKKPTTRQDFEEIHLIEMAYFQSGRSKFRDMKILAKTVLKVFQANSF
jgi:lipopolysaccharide/colanic/teichoic acid biosynthesis glycosyltransferase